MITVGLQQISCCVLHLAIINCSQKYKADEGVDREQLANSNKVVNLCHDLIFDLAQYKGTLSCTHAMHTNMFVLCPLVIAAFVSPTLSATSIGRLKLFSNWACNLCLFSPMNDRCNWVK